MWARSPGCAGQALTQLGRAGEGGSPTGTCPREYEAQNGATTLGRMLLEIEFSLLSRSNSEAITTDLP